MITYPVSGCPHITTDAYEYERDLLRIVELTLRNPRTGSDDAAELHTLCQKTRRIEAALFPFPTDPQNGDVCACSLECAGVACGCWCHKKGSVNER